MMKANIPIILKRIKKIESWQYRLNNNKELEVVENPIIDLIIFDKFNKKRLLKF